MIIKQVATGKMSRHGLTMVGMHNRRVGGGKVGSVNGSGVIYANAGLLVMMMLRLLGVVVV